MIHGTIAEGVTTPQACVQVAAPGFSLGRFFCGLVPERGTSVNPSGSPSSMGYRVSWGSPESTRLYGGSRPPCWRVAGPSAPHRANQAPKAIQTHTGRDRKGPITTSKKTNRPTRPRSRSHIHGQPNPGDTKPRGIPTIIQIDKGCRGRFQRSSLAHTLLGASKLRVFI